MTSLTSDSEAERWGDSVAQVNQQMLHNGSSDARRRSFSISFGETPLLPSLYTTFAMASKIHIELKHPSRECRVDIV